MNKTLLTWQSDKYFNQDLILRLITNITGFHHDMYNIFEIDSTFETRLIGNILYNHNDNEGFIFNLKSYNESLSDYINIKFYAKGNDMITEFTQDANTSDRYVPILDFLTTMLNGNNIVLNNDTTYNQNKIQLELIG